MKLRATYGATGDRFYADHGSLKAFLVDRSRYYTEAPDGFLRYAVVDHQPWPLYGAVAHVQANTLFAANGFEMPESEPTYLYSPGVDTVATESLRA